MTTAHRPTWKPSYGLSDAVNKGYVPTRSYSARVTLSPLRTYPATSNSNNEESVKDLSTNLKKETSNPTFSSEKQPPNAKKMGNSKSSKKNQLPTAIITTFTMMKSISLVVMNPRFTKRSNYQIKKNNQST